MRTGSTNGEGPDALLWALVVVLLSYVWRLHSLFPLIGSLQIPLLSAGVAMGLLAFDSDARRQLAKINGPILWLLGGLAAIMVVGAPFALIQGKVFSFFTRDFLPSVVLLTGLSAVAVRSEKDIRWLTGVHVCGAVVYCLVILSRFSAVGGRLGGLVYYDSNDLAMLLVITFPFALYFLLEGRDARTRLLSGGSLLLFLVTLVNTGSRGGFVGFCVVGLWILVRYGSIPARRRIAALVGAVVVLGFWGSDDYWNQMSTLLTPTQDYNWAGGSEVGRMEVWERGVGYMLDRPLVGVGARNFADAEGRLSRLGQLNRLGGPGFKWSAAHNSFVEIGAELGVIGLVLFLLLLYKGYRIAGRPPPSSIGDGASRRRSKALRQAFRVALVGYAATGFFLSAAYDPVLYALLGLVAGLAKVDRMAEASPALAGTPSESRRARPVYRLVRESERRPAP